MGIGNVSPKDDEKDLLERVFSSQLEMLKREAIFKIQALPTKEQKEKKLTETLLLLAETRKKLVAIFEGQSEDQPAPKRPSKRKLTRVK